MLLVWEIQYVLAEVFWLVEKPGLTWPQGSELQEAETILLGSGTVQRFLSLGIFNYLSHVLDTNTTPSYFFLN